MVTNTSSEASSRKAANGTIKLITCGTVFWDVFHKAHCFHWQKFPLPSHRNVAAAFFESNLTNAAFYGFLCLCYSFQQQDHILKTA